MLSKGSRYYEDLITKYTGVVSRTTLGEVLSLQAEPFDCGCGTNQVVFVHLPQASRVWRKYYHAVLTVCDGSRCNDKMRQFTDELDEYIGIVDEGFGLGIAS